MSFDPVKLSAALPSLAALSDADAATALSSPILALRTDPITYTTLGRVDVLGTDAAAALTKTLAQAAASGDAASVYADKVLSVGFLATDPGAATFAQKLVTAGLCTQAQAITVLNVVSYRCDDVVTAADVTTARAALALSADYLACRRKVAALMDWLDAGLHAGTPAPSLADLTAKLATITSPGQ